MKKCFKLLLTIVLLCLVIAVPSQAATKKTQKISVKGDGYYNKTYGNKAFNLGAKAKTTLSYISNNKKVATVDKKGKVTIKNAGEAVITIKAATTKQYKAATKKIYLSVSPKSSKKAVATIVLTDGTSIKAGSGVKIPLSKLEGAKVTFDSLGKGTIWYTVAFASYGEYWLAEDPEPNWAYDNIYFDKDDKKLAEKVWKSNGWNFNDVSTDCVIDKYTVQYFKNGGFWDFGEWIDVPESEPATHLYVAVSPMNIKNVTGKYCYENNFEIDLNK